ncbi:SbcC/MukB-like Walker B domain-containing protein [Plebeiibacterium sediminum]|uniref:AAA family ATPase n=1 Tax=Plebeiibacterium sediminum TaxID=2992112 RepID=A0AAE3M1L9_9BACT|nr:SbcC/MukB-like Walker B domain-containing protein [Plebeiobacterium sediminum]MCW3785468.1 AAA family ATPase [Plebeiobacterium sediminum]
MIPVKLTIEGLYSYQSKQSIDFKKLSDNHLFGIFGSVGSGKSSILEAIIFSLYGKTDRLLKSGDNRNYNMMNLKSDKLFIEFDFITGKDQKEFKVVVEGRRNSKKFDDVKTFSRTAYIKNGGDYAPITTEELEDFIGLSYENFKRTVIIPQGKFQEFLQLSNAERTKMMKELFNLEKYELYNKTKRLEEKNNESINKLKGSLEQLGDVSDEQLTELETKQKETTAKLSSLNEKQEKQTILLKELDQLKENTLLLDEFSKKKKVLDEKSSTIKKLEKDIADYEYCAIQFKSICDAIDRHQAKINQLNQNIKSETETHKALKETYGQKSKDYTKIQSEYEQLDERRKELEFIKKLMDISLAKAKVEKNLSRKENGEKAVKDVIEAISTLETLEKEKSAYLTELRKSLPNIEELSQAQKWHLENNNFIKQLNDITLEHDKLKNTIHNNTSEINELIQNSAFKNGDTKDFNKYLELINEESVKTEQELKKINILIEENLIYSGLERYAQNLKDGSQCPLCGSESHPEPFSNHDLTTKVNNLKKSKSDIENKVKQLNTFFQQINNKIIVLKPQTEQLVTLENKKQDVKLQYEKHQNSVITKFKDINIVNEAVAKIKETQTIIDKTEKELSINKSNYQESLKNKEKYQIGLQKIQSEIDAEQNTIKVLSQQIPSAFFEKYDNFNNTKLQESYDDVSNSINKITKEYKQLHEEIESVKKKIDQLEGSLSANQNFLKAEESEITKQKQILNDKILASEFTDLTSIKTILAKDIDINKEKEIITNYHKEHQTVDHKIKELQALLLDKKYDSNEHAQCIAELKSITADINTTNQIQGEISTKIKDLRKKLFTKVELEKDLNIRNERGENIKIMKRMFHGSGFVNYISSVYLQNLCLAANERFFKMTKQKLSLELSNDNNFEVRDYLNGGKLRSVKTLSGGQTFQAALSLALALADNVQALTQTDQNFFFLDEGFGSLDKESMEIVFNTLKGLKKENRIVGIISHVEELQQEIPLFLKIVQDEESGSCINESY